MKAGAEKLVCCSPRESPVVFVSIVEIPFRVAIASIPRSDLENNIPLKRLNTHPSISKAAFQTTKSLHRTKN